MYTKDNENMIKQKCQFTIIVEYFAYHTNQILITNGLLHSRDDDSKVHNTHLYENIKVRDMNH